MESLVEKSRGLGVCSAHQGSRMFAEDRSQLASPNWDHGRELEMRRLDLLQLLHGMRGDSIGCPLG